MTLENQDFTIYNANHALLYVFISEEDLITPKNLTGATINWAIYDNDSDIILVTKSTALGGGITITNAVLGLCTIALVPADTANLIPTKSYMHEGQVTDLAGDITTVFTGQVNIKRSIV